MASRGRLRKARRVRNSKTTTTFTKAVATSCTFFVAPTGRRWIRGPHSLQILRRSNGRGDGCGVDHQWKALWLRFLDPNRADEGYFYSAEFQHAWRTVARDGYSLAYGKSYGESCTYSCVEGWWDFSIPPKAESYSYRLLGEQPILAAMDATIDGAGIANGRLTSETFQVRRAYVIEMKPRDPHSPALNAIVFIDPETYLWLAAEFSFSDGPQAAAMPCGGTVATQTETRCSS